MTRLRASRGRQAGFSLIEGLVSILIFSLGILALVGLQANSMKQANNAKYRSDASMLVNGLIGQMWVTDRSAATLQSNFNTGGTAYTAWLTDVQAALPVAAASAPSVSVSAAGLVTVNLYWKSPSEQADAPAHQYTVIAQVK